MQEAATETSLLSTREVKKFVPVSDMALWRWTRAGTFPKPVKVGRFNFWRADELNAWLAERSADRTAA